MTNPSCQPTTSGQQQFACFADISGHFSRLGSCLQHNRHTFSPQPPRIHRLLSLLSLGAQLTMQRKIRFINVAEPSARFGQNEKRHERQARSHAAREGHARTRRLRMLNHLASTESAVPSLLPQGEAPPEADNEMHALILSSPVGLLSADRSDPFSTLAMSLRPFEYFLLDHCASLIHH